jgi:hypothetical protein
MTRLSNSSRPVSSARRDCKFEIGLMQPLIAVKRATMLLRFDWLLGLIGALLS